ncbi:helix-turn-helix domain-containing protein (plasmid) [Amycolatopsis sp. FU40]|uniref:helix-turn-helix domain-containing protein n=1 Tax=Amycolatopsis sp. FU40 TaxID=2914159 RepID=UPI001F478486|nr:helix-turn-helix transcriptional regulator [Amycolatopsis sp. FU40]UKD50824.1 helix-turn-helix domain-containing protein [Amycolatopsis sp. FU40]
MLCSVPVDCSWAFGVRLRAAREQLRLSRREAARRAGLSEARWRQLEKGTQPIDGVEQPVSTRPDTVFKAADVVGLDPREALLLAGFEPDEHLISSDLAAIQRRELLDWFDQITPARRAAVLGMIRAFSAPLALTDDCRSRYEAGS